MSTPTPFQSLLGGIGTTFPVHALFLLNGSVFGVSGFIHRAARGSLEGAASVVGLILGGAVCGFVDGPSYRPDIIPGGLARVAAAGFLVGVGSKIGCGCTSGHMLSGFSRLSVRSIAATASFFVTALITTRLLYGNLLPPTGPIDWSAGPHIKTYLALQAASLALEAVEWLFAENPPAAKEAQPDEGTPLSAPPQDKGSRVLRTLTSFLTAFHFSIPLRVSNLVSSLKVTAFLLTPFDAAFDPSLVFVAIGALPLGILLHRYARPRDPEAREKPRLGGEWAVPSRCDIDKKLLAGAATFGVGWGLAGVCPAPGLINLGRVLATRSDPTQQVVWLLAVVLGGFVEL